MFSSYMNTVRSLNIMFSSVFVPLNCLGSSTSSSVMRCWVMKFSEFSPVVVLPFVMLIVSVEVVLASTTTSSVFLDQSCMDYWFRTLTREWVQYDFICVNINQLTTSNIIYLIANIVQNNFSNFYVLMYLYYLKTRLLRHTSTLWSFAIVIMKFSNFIMISATTSSDIHLPSSFFVTSNINFSILLIHTTSYC